MAGDVPSIHAQQDERPLLGVRVIQSPQRLSVARTQSTIVFQTRRELCASTALRSPIRPNIRCLLPPRCFRGPGALPLTSSQLIEIMARPTRFELVTFAF